MVKLYIISDKFGMPNRYTQNIHSQPHSKAVGAIAECKLNQ